MGTEKRVYIGRVQRGDTGNEGRVQSGDTKEENIERVRSGSRGEGRCRMQRRKQYGAARAARREERRGSELGLGVP